MVLVDAGECLIKGCSGLYIAKVIDVIEVRGGKKIDVTESICNKCGDDQDERLVKFIRENL